MIIGIISVISIGIIITLCVIFIPKKKSDKPEETSIKTEIIIPPPSPPQIDLKLGSEFNFTNKEGSLQRISIKQKYQEDRMIDGEKITTFSTKNTNYDIYQKKIRMKKIRIFTIKYMNVLYLYKVNVFHHQMKIVNLKKD